MAGAFVQGAFAFADASSQGTLVATFGSNVTAGNLICGLAKFGTATSVFNNFTDTLLNTFNNVDTNASLPGAGTGISFYSKNIAGGADAVTLNFTGTTGVFPRLIILEFSGLDTSAPLNAHEFLNQSSVTFGVNNVSSDNGTSTATNIDGCSIVGITVNCVRFDTMAAGTNFTLRTVGSTAPNDFDHLNSEERVQASQGIVHASFSPSGGTGVSDFGTFMMAFAPLSGSNILMAQACL